MKLRNHIKIIALFCLLAFGAGMVSSCNNSRRGMKVKSSGKIGDPGDKNRHVWGK